MPNTVCDLHTHTYYSDGRASPAELLHHAAGLGLKTIAITDHDNLNAHAEADNVAERLGLELIPGVELTARWDDCHDSSSTDRHTEDVDVLAYFFDPADPGFQAFLQDQTGDLHARIAECCRLLTQAGYPIDIYDVLDQNERYPGAMQLIGALWQKGYADSWRSAFSLFARVWPQVPPARTEIGRAIAAVHAAGGVAVLAHPISVECGRGWLSSERVAALVELGLDGLEVYHPRLDAPARDHFLKIAGQFGLLISGGSDEHGWPGGFPRLGSELVTYEMVKGLRLRAGLYQGDWRT